MLIKNQGFYINLVVGAVFAPGYIFLLPHTHVDSVKTLSQKLRMIDWIGIIFFLGGCTDLIVAITFVGSAYDWHSGTAIALWTVAGVLLVVTIVVSLWHPGVAAEDRLLPVHFFTNLEQLNLALQMFLSSGVMLGTVYYIPLYFSFTKVRWPLSNLYFRLLTGFFFAAQGDDALQSGVKLLPFVCLMVFGAITNGAMMPKTGHYMPWYVAGSALATIGCGLMRKFHFILISVESTYSSNLLIPFNSLCKSGYQPSRSLWLRSSDWCWRGVLCCCRTCRITGISTNGGCVQRRCSPEHL